MKSSSANSGDAVVWVGLLAIADGRLLVLKEHTKDFFMLPGGKQEPGESDRETLEREITEELGCEVNDAKWFRAFTAEAKTTKRMMRFRLYRGNLIGFREDHLPKTTETVTWISSAWRDELSSDVGNLLKQHVLPVLTDADMLR